jgi:polysaccharide export outer membrane protein
VVVSGRVMKPGAYATTQHTTLLELVGLAGGPDTNADLTGVSLVHSGSKTPEAVNLQAFIDGKLLTGNPSLSNGDIVMVPEKATVGTVFVLGEVKRFGACDLRHGMRIHDAIGQAGGTTDMADPQAATLKSKDGEPKKFDLVKALAQDPVEDKVLSPGDTIYIQPTSGTFNIYGAVNKPGSYSIKQPTPLTDALAMAGGYTARAKIENARILRSSQQKSMDVNLANVEKMKAENMAILPGDTIVIPERGEKTNIWQMLSAAGALRWLFP